jgi:hypothetical protein
MNQTEKEKLYAFFYETVVLVYQAYKTTRNEAKAGTRNDWKSALTAATAAYHFREHLPQPHKKSRREIAAICPDYDLLGDVVNASKHKDVTFGKLSAVESKPATKGRMKTSHFFD